VHAQVVVVGGGPIGAVAARSAAQAGASVLLVERRKRPAPSSCCTGLVGPQALRILGVSTNCALLEIRGVSVHAPSVRKLELSANDTKAIVIDRLRLERELHDLARAEGVDVRLGVKAIAASDGAVVLESNGGQETIDASFILGADGPGSQVAQWFGLPSPERFVHAAQVVVETQGTTASDRVDVFLGNEVAPGFFAWAVPEGRNRLRVGVGVSSTLDPWPYLDRLLASRFPKSRTCSREGGRIPVAPTPRSATGSVLLVGDAAGQVKPLSGGGLYPGGVCARIAGRIAAETALSGASDPQAAFVYESEWKAAIGREITFGQSLHRLYSSLSDDDLNALIAACDDPELLAFLAEQADIDRLHRLPDELAARPSLWGKVLRLLPLVAGRDTDDVPDRPSVASVLRTCL
jgi:digeranylgeranylglycerophospholipid reductase